MVKLNIDSEIATCNERFISFFGNARSWLEKPLEVSQRKTSARHVFSQILSQYEHLSDAKLDEKQQGEVERIYCRLSGIQAVVGDTIGEINEESIQQGKSTEWKDQNEYDNQIGALLEEVRNIRDEDLPFDCKWADVHAIYKRICLHLPQFKERERVLDAEIKKDKPNFLLVIQKNTTLDGFESIVSNVQNIFRNCSIDACLNDVKSPKLLTALPIWELKIFRNNMAGTAEKEAIQYGQNGGVLFHEEKDAETHSRSVDLDLIFNKLTITERHLCQLVEKNYKGEPESFGHVAERSYYMTEFYKRKYGEQLKLDVSSFPKRTFKLPVWSKADFAEYISMLDDANTKKVDRFYYLKMLSLHIDDLLSLHKNEIDAGQKGEYLRIYHQIHNFICTSKELINSEENLSVWKGYLPKKIAQYSKVFGSLDSVEEDATDEVSVDSDVEDVEVSVEDVSDGGSENAEPEVKKGFFGKIASAATTAGGSVGAVASGGFDKVVVTTATVVSFTKDKFSKKPADTTANNNGGDLQGVAAGPVIYKDDGDGGSETSDDITGDEASIATGDERSDISVDDAGDDRIEEVESTDEEILIKEFDPTASGHLSVALESTDYKKIDIKAQLLRNASGKTRTLLEEKLSRPEVSMSLEKMLREAFANTLTRVISNGNDAKGKPASRPFALGQIGKRLPFELPFDGVVFEVVEKVGKDEHKPLEKYFLISKVDGGLSVKLVTEDNEGSRSYDFSIAKMDEETYAREGILFIQKIIERFSPEGKDIWLQPNYFKHNQLEDRKDG